MSKNSCPFSYSKCVIGKFIHLTDYIFVKKETKRNKEEDSKQLTCCNVLVLDGYLEIGVHDRSDFGYLICLRHLCRSETFTFF